MSTHCCVTFAASGRRHARFCLAPPRRWVIRKDAYRRDLPWTVWHYSPAYGGWVAWLTATDFTSALHRMRESEAEGRVAAR